MRFKTVILTLPHNDRHAYTISSRPWSQLLFLSFLRTLLEYSHLFHHLSLSYFIFLSFLLILFCFFLASTTVSHWWYILICFTILYLLLSLSSYSSLLSFTFHRFFSLLLLPFLFYPFFSPLVLPCREHLWQCMSHISTSGIAWRDIFLLHDIPGWLLTHAWRELNT